MNRNMFGRRTTGGVFGLFLALAVLGLGSWNSAWAFHFPWDQGHDTFNPDDPDDPDPDDNNDNDDDGDPVDLIDGNFRYERTRHDVRILDQGPMLELLFTYHSRDFYQGPFGRGWHSSLTSNAIDVTDGDLRHVIIRQGDGRRKRYRLESDGSFESPPGIYHSLVRNGDGSFTLTFKGGLEHNYNANGQLVTITDINGLSVNVDYDSTGAIMTATTASGRSVEFVKGPNGKIATVSDSLVGDYDYEYSTDGLLTKVTDPLGNETRYEYDGEKRMVRVFAPNGIEEIENTYDTEDRVTRQVLLNNSGYRFDFNYSSIQSGRVTVTRRKSGAATVTATHNFDSEGFPTTTQLPTSAGGTITRAYDTNFNLISVTDSGGQTTYEYDSKGNIIRSVFPDNTDVRFTYDPLYSRVTLVQDVTNGRTATVAYDDAGGTITVQDVNGVSASFPIDAFGLLGVSQRALGDVPPVTARYALYQDPR